MTLRPSTAPLRVPLPSPPSSSLPVLADPASDSLRAASPTVARLLSNVVTDPSFDSTAASALVAELVDFAAHCRLDYAASLVAESASVCPPSVGGECALSTDVLEDRQEEFQCFVAALPHLVSTLIAPEGDPDAPDIPTPRSYAEAIEGPYSSQWQSAMDAEMASWNSTGTYVDEVPPPGANIVSGMWIFRVKRPPGSPPVFKARYVARGFSQRQGFDYFQTFSPTPKMTTLRVLLHVAAQRDYELHSLDFSTAFLLFRPVYGLRQVPREWHDTLRTTLAALGFTPSTADPSLFLRTDTSLPPFYVLVYVDDSVFATADTTGLAHVKSELQKRDTCTDLGELRSYLGLQIARDKAQRTITLTQSHMVQQVLQRFDFTYSSPQATPLSTRHSLSALPSDESVEPSGPYPELVGCLIGPPSRNHFYSRHNQRGQLRLAYVASEANTADIFTKALPPGDHQRFCTMLACFALLDWSCDLLFSYLYPTHFASSFIPHSSQGVTFTWGEKEHAAFSTLKNVICSPPVLRIADPHRPFEVVTDAIDIAIGAVLLQDFGNGLQPIAYESRKLHPPEKKLPDTRSRNVCDRACVQSVVLLLDRHRCDSTDRPQISTVPPRTTPPQPTTNPLARLPRIEFSLHGHLPKGGIEHRRRINPAHSPSPRHTTRPDQPTANRPIYPRLSD
ncbi:unnamed protein product [Closterium sp. NIES-53]